VARRQLVEVGLRDGEGVVGLEAVQAPADEDLRRLAGGEAGGAEASTSAAVNTTVPTSVFTWRVPRSTRVVSGIANGRAGWFGSARLIMPAPGGSTA
jgi:hypothetical protein